MLFWVIVNPIRYSLVRGIKWLEASGIPELLHKYYALWNEMRVRKMQSEEVGKVDGYVTIKHLGPVKAFFLLISGMALVVWLLEFSAGFIKCRKSKPEREWGQIVCGEL